MDKGKLAIAAVVWLVVIASGAMIYKWWFVPTQQQAEQQAKLEEKNKILTETGADSRYDSVLNFALDGFSGYAVLRSQEFANKLGNQRIKLNLIDDGANYPGRLKKIGSGDIQMGVFTIDALIKASHQAGSVPVTIVSIIDETRGADAAVSFKKAIPSLDALNHKDTKFVLTPDSPSETLARVVMAHFNLTNLSKDPFIRAKDAEDVYKRYRTAKPDQRQVFVLWEPYVSKILENPNTHRVVDSSRFKGYIVDVIVVNRNFLYSNRDVVSKVVRSYFRTNYDFNEKIELVLEDAKLTRTPLTQKQAEALVDGLWWKNTQENYCHFGLKRGSNLQHIEDIISNITGVLIKTGGISADPTASKPNLLYYPDILEEMQTSGFHPGVENVRDDKVILPTLTDHQWGTLQPVGTLSVPRLVFARGTSVLLDQSKRVLDKLVESLNTWPQYYVLIKGDATRRGDIGANKALALARAEAARKYLMEKGIRSNRIKATAVEPSGVTAVNFVLGQLPY